MFLAFDGRTLLLLDDLDGVSQISRAIPLLILSEGVAERCGLSPAVSIGQ